MYMYLVCPNPFSEVIDSVISAKTRTDKHHLVGGDFAVRVAKITGR